MRKENFTVLIALDSNDKAMGQLYWDDGDSIDPIEKGEYSLISFNVQNVSNFFKNYFIINFNKNSMNYF
jgi:hypothetical protein